MLRMPPATRDIVLASCTLLVCGAVYFDLKHVRVIAGQDPLGSAGLPMATIIIIAALCVFLMVRALWTFRRPVEASRVPAAPDGIEGALRAPFSDHLLTAGFLVLSLLYALSMDLRIDFTLSTFIFLVVGGAMISDLRPRSLMVTVVVAAILAFGCDYVFTKIFLIDLP